MRKIQWYCLGGVLAGSFLAIAVSVMYLQIRGHTTQQMGYTLEYDNVVAEHIDTTKIFRREIDSSVTKQELSERFAIYQFSHPKLRGKWGDLNVLVDRQTGKSISRSLLPVNKKSPTFTLSELPECLNVEQPGQKIYEICVN
jgi:hypothetical protein